MAEVNELQSSPMSGFNLNNLKWYHLEGGPEFDYPINYWWAILGARPEEGCLDFLVKWEPNSYCHFHRHVGNTTSLILEGEHHVIDTTPTQTIHKIRKAGHYVSNPAHEVHMEHAGSEGSMVFFSMQSADGRLFEILDKNENILSVVTIDSLVSGRFAS